MYLAASLLITSIIGGSKPKEAFIVPRLEPNQIVVDYVELGKSPELLWQRRHPLYRSEDDDGMNGNSWIVSNLLLTLSPDGQCIFAPFVDYRKGQLEIGGTILRKAASKSELPRFKIPYQFGMELYYGWNGSCPAVVEELDDKRGAVHTLRNGKWAISKTVPSSLSSLEKPRLFLGEPIAGSIVFNCSWQCSYLPTRSQMWDNIPIMGRLNTRIAVSNHKNLMLISGGEIRSSEDFVHTENILPLSGGRVIGRIYTSFLSRKRFEGLWGEDTDPFLDSNVFVFDLNNGRSTFIDKGLFGLPVSSDWAPIKQKQVTHPK